MTPVALTLAGSDPSGGAGLQADLKCFHQFGVYGMSVITLITVQNTRQVGYLRCIEADVILAQLDAVLGDIPPQAIKLGALGCADTVRALGKRAREIEQPLVIDPVMISKHGQPLLDRDAVEVLKWDLLPYATIVTPNVHEAQVLADHAIESLDDMHLAAERIAAQGPAHVLIKGGPRGEQAVDVLYSESEFQLFSREHIETPHTHGSGCAFSATITAHLAKGCGILESVRAAKQFVWAAIATAPQFGETGPINMHATGE